MVIITWKFAYLFRNFSRQKLEKLEINDKSLCLEASLSTPLINFFPDFRLFNSSIFYGETLNVAKRPIGNNNGVGTRYTQNNVEPRK